MTESFEEVYDRVYSQLHNPCGMWKAGMVKEWMDDLMTAHDHELEQLRRSRFREGYEAGQRSMDAAHYLLKLRLQGLKFGDGSHENLSRLAYAIYPCPTGWGKESCEGLRDKLIELLGGVHDEPAQIPASVGACDADCDCHNQQPQAVAYDELGNERHKAVCALRNERDNMSDNMADNVSRIMYAIDARPKVDERACKAIADRLIYLLGGDEPYSNLTRTSLEPNLPKSAEFAKPESEDGGENCRMTDEIPRLVYFPTDKYMELNGESLVESLVKNTEELSRKGKVKFPPNADGSLDSLKTVEETAALIDEVKRRAEEKYIEYEGDCLTFRDGLGGEMKLVNGDILFNGKSFMDALMDGTDEPDSQESPILSNCDTENGCEVTITDELRKWASTEVPYKYGHKLHAIADRIDEQFKRICWQQEAVLQHTIDTMVDERDKLVDNRDMWRGKAMQLTDVVDRYVGRCEDLLDLLRDAAVDFKNASYGWNYALIVGENITIETERNRLLKERDELRKSLREIAERAGVPHDIDLDEYSDDLVAKATLGKIDSTHEYIGALEWQRDRQRKLLDEYENADTPEDIVRDIHLGKVTDSQAVERIRALNG